MPTSIANVRREHVEAFIEDQLARRKPATAANRDPRTVTYLQRRLAQGRTKPEIIRSLKRYVAREIYRQLFA